MSEKITFRELVELIAEQSKQSQSSTNDFVSELVGVIENGLRETGSVSISGFGKFELRWMKEREGRNPQTGEPLTIPAQNKVYFKPFKALREDVNRPYSNMEATILDDISGETDKASETETGTKPAIPSSPKEKAETTEPDISDEEEKEQEQEQEAEKKASAKSGSPIPLAPPEEPEEEDNGDHLLIERSVPESTDQMQEEDEVEIEEEEKVKNEHEYEGLLYSPDRSGEVIPESLFSVPEPAESETAPKTTPVSTASSSLAKKSARPDKEKTRFFGVRWLDIAAGVILILSVVAIYFMLRQPPVVDAPQQVASEQQQEQMPEPEQTEPAPEPAPEPQSEQEQETTDQPAPAEDEPVSDAETGNQAGADVEPGADTDAESAFDTSPYTINRGESLWSISEIRMNNPYFWPVIYNLNSDMTNNPNLIPANAQLSVPFIPNPENLTSQQLEEVARGYLSVYDWAVDNQPENARFYLWAVGVYSADVLADAENRVDPDHWQFAVRR